MPNTLHEHAPGSPALREVDQGLASVRAMRASWLMFVGVIFATVLLTVGLTSPSAHSHDAATAARIAGKPAPWLYPLDRATGIVALALLTASVMLGVLGSMRFSREPKWPQFALARIHRDVSLLVVVLLAVHIASVLSSFAPIMLVDAVLPFTSAYRSVWIGLGALSLDVVLAVMVTSVLRRRVGQRAWRAIHWASYAAWPLALAHGLTAGVDGRAGWMLAYSIVSIGVVLAAVRARIVQARPRRRLVVLAIVLAGVSTLGMVVLALAGPLSPGWNARAGGATPARKPATPPAKVAKVPAKRPAVKAPVRPPVTMRHAIGSFVTAIAGTRAVIHSGRSSLTRVVVRFAHPEGVLIVTLASRAGSGSAVLRLTGTPMALTGHAARLGPGQFTATVASSASVPLTLRLTLRGSTGARITGTLRGGRR